jgi:hypothetical protein
LAGNQNFAAVGCSDGSLVVYSTFGGRRVCHLTHFLSFVFFSFWCELLL